MLSPRKRTAAASAGWIFSGTVLYLSLVALELQWNLFTWSPRLDYITLGALGAMALAWGCAWLSARNTRNRLTFALGSTVCVLLLGLGLYLLRPEPLETGGLLPRTQSSPFWYRGARLLALAAPVAFLALRLRKTRTAGQASARPAAHESSAYSADATKSPTSEVE